MFLRVLMHSVLSGLIILGFALPAMAETPTMTVSELSPGMVGVGRTVISGTEIEEFRCEIIDVFTSMGYNGEALIMVRLSGDVIDATGGIAGGYSGSPVYIDGKLIGALSWGPYYTEGDVAGITPINEMLKAFTYPDQEPPRITSEPMEFAEPVEVAGAEYTRLALAGFGEGEEVSALYGEETLVMTPCRTPLMVSGLSEEGMNILREFATDRLPYLDIVQGPGGGSQGVPILLGPTVLEPGASIGAQLASGDLDLTAVGTLTWVDDDGRFLAFGHPFLMDGATDLPFLTTKIVYTMPALDRSYKLGEPLEIVGTITQDRLTCIAGNLRQTPEMVNFNLRVTDLDLDHTRTYNYSVVNKEEWLAILGWVMPLEGIAYAMDREGEITCRVGFSIRGEGLAEPIERENLVYSAYGASGSLVEFYEALNMLTTANPYREVKVTDVDIEVEITSAHQSMDIMRARFQNPPNMGPGAIGYEGVESMEDKETKDDLVNEQAGWLDSEMEELQEVPEGEFAGVIETAEMIANDTMVSGMYNLVKYMPGDTMEVMVTLRPYREDPVEQVIELKIPEDFPIGVTTLEIFGGVTSYYAGSGAYYLDTSGLGYYGGDYYNPPSTLDEAIMKFTQRDVNNTLIVRLMRPMSEDPYYYLIDDYELPEPVRSVLDMEDVIFGYYTLPIEIGGATSPEYYAPEIVTEPVQVQGQTSNSRNPHRD